MIVKYCCSCSQLSVLGWRAILTSGVHAIGDKDTWLLAILVVSKRLGGEGEKRRGRRKAGVHTCAPAVAVARRATSLPCPWQALLLDVG